MFVEKYFEIKEENLRQEGRQEGLKKGRQEGRQTLAEEFRSLISSTDGDVVTKDDLRKLLEKDNNE